MKTILLILISFASMNLCFGQEITEGKTHEDYIKAGNSELIIGSIFVGASIPIFLRLASGESDLDNYPMLIAGGVVLLGAGIALLSSSGKNFGKARELSAHVTYQPLNGLRVTSKQMGGVPGLKLQFSF